MRWDQLSGWQLFAAQIVALLVATPLLWGIGALFRRSRTARWVSMGLALVLGAGLAVGRCGWDGKELTGDGARRGLTEHVADTPVATPAVADEGRR